MKKLPFLLSFTFTAVAFGNHSAMDLIRQENSHLHAAIASRQKPTVATYEANGDRYHKARKSLETIENLLAGRTSTISTTTYATEMERVEVFKSLFYAKKEDHPLALDDYLHGTNLKQPISGHYICLMIMQMAANLAWVNDPETWQGPSPSQKYDHFIEYLNKTVSWQLKDYRYEQNVVDSFNTYNQLPLLKRIVPKSFLLSLFQVYTLRDSSKEPPADFSGFTKVFMEEALKNPDVINFLAFVQIQDNAVNPANPVKVKEKGGTKSRPEKETSKAVQTPKTPRKKEPGRVPPKQPAPTPAKATELSKKPTVTHGGKGSNRAHDGEGGGRQDPLAHFDFERLVIPNTWNPHVTQGVRPINLSEEDPEMGYSSLNLGGVHFKRQNVLATDLDNMDGHNLMGINKCFFNAIGVEVEDTIKKLLQPESLQDPKLRWMIGCQVADLFMENTEGFRDRLKAKISLNTFNELDKLEKDKNQHGMAAVAAARQEIYEAYVNNFIRGEMMSLSYRMPGDFSGDILYTAVDAISYVHKIGVIVLMPQEDKPKILMPQHYALPQGYNKIAYVYHLGRHGFHFQALIPE